jgi:hypothetical protein
VSYLFFISCKYYTFTKPCSKAAMSAFNQIMDKNILVVYYSQTGQLKEIVDRFCTPFVDHNINVEIVNVPLLEEYAFPWTGKRFFDVFPESVSCIPVALGEVKFKRSSYDLIIFAYQPWYLSPSIPATSILKNPEFIKVLKGSNVVTLIGSRNLWLEAQEKVKAMLNDAGAKLVGNVVLEDKSNYLASAVSILHWLINGKKEKYLGIFPKPGVSDEDIHNSSSFGEIVLKSLEKNDYTHLQKELVEKGAVEVKRNFMLIESRAIIMFTIWARVILKKKNRSLWLSLFKYYLIFVLFIVSPIILTINAIFFRPFFTKSVEIKKKYFLGVN